MSDVPPIVWEPSAARIERAAITRFARWLAAERGVATDGYASLHAWSVREPAAFWEALAAFYDVRFHDAPSAVLGRRAMPGAEWFPDATLSYAEHALRAAPGDDTTPAILHASESRPLATWTRGELRARVAAIAGGLRALGVGPGDRVAAYLPNIPETVAAFLACASIGAIWSSCAPEFGARTILDRFGQIEPKVFLAVDGYRYNGRDHDRRELVAEIAAAIPSIEHTVVLGYLDGSEEHAAGGIANALPWSALEALGADTPLAFAPLPFDHPLWVLYSSGTTGPPKAIVQGAGGILLEHLKVVGLHIDATPGDRFFWFTTTGWMMWNLLVGGLLVGCPIVLFDGNPGLDGMTVLFDLAAAAGVTIFGTSASFLAAAEKAGVVPRDGRDLSALAAVGSTGSPLAPESYDWVRAQLGDVWLFSTSGGTDLCTAFVGGVPTLPVHRGELQAAALGAAVEAWDPVGRPLVGEVGELVLTVPMPSMPIGLWGDDDGSRYAASYFDVYPGIWRHGDWIRFTERGSAVISGRSDATINRGGVRMGTAELYRAALAVPAVVDALVVDLPRGDGESWMPMFVVLREGLTLDDALADAIRRRIREDCSPRHVPDRLVQIAAVPRTLSGKALEVPVKRLLMGAPAASVTSRDALRNPEALDWFADHSRELRP